MNKQEQIEKMIDVVVANTFIEAGYINGADFVKYLKSQQELEPPYDDDCLCGYIDVDKLDELLQDYLKGE